MEKSMKLSILPVSFFPDINSGRMSLVDWARIGVELGLDGIDVSTLLLPTYDKAKLRKIRDGIEAEGIAVLGSSSYPDFTNPDPEIRKREREQIEEDLEALAELGTRIVRITAGQAHPGLDRSEGLNLALDGILAAVPKAQSLGIELLLENHGKPGVWDYYDFDYPTDVFLDLAEALEDTPVGIQFDTANPIAYGDDPLPILKKVYPKVSLVHVADTGTRGKLSPSVIGRGLVDFDEIFGYLIDQDYDGWLSIEEASFTGVDGMKTAVDFTKSTWSKKQERVSGRI